jgi:hypothetical protein
MSRQLMLLVKGNKGDAMTALMGHGLFTTDFKVYKDYREVACYIPDPTPEQHRDVGEWFCESGATAPNGGFDPGTLLFYN